MPGYVWYSGHWLCFDGHEGTSRGRKVKYGIPDMAGSLERNDGGHSGVECSGVEHGSQA